MSETQKEREKPKYGASWTPLSERIVDSPEAARDIKRQEVPMAHILGAILLGVPSFLLLLLSLSYLPRTVPDFISVLGGLGNAFDGPMNLFFFPFAVLFGAAPFMASFAAIVITSCGVYFSWRLLQTPKITR